MGFISEEILEQIRQRSDIVEVVSQFVPLKKRGNDYWGCCPFHNEKTPSFKVNQERGGYYCFGCKEHGSVFDFVKSMLNTDFPGAARWLAERSGITIPENSGSKLPPDEAARLRKLKEKRYALLESVAKWYHSLLTKPEAQAARNYLRSRGLDAESIEHFQLGYSPEGWDGTMKWATAVGYDISDLMETGLIIQKEDGRSYYDRFRGRLMFPIWDENGKVCGFSARTLEQNPKSAKYVNSPESEFFHKGELLYAMNFARANMKKSGYALVCEGQLDIISCHRAGLNFAIAAEGTAFTENHARLLRKSVKKVRLCFDADTAGYKASQRTIKLLHAQDLDVEVVTLPSDEDPDSVFRKGGAEALSRLMSETEEAIPYLYRVLSSQTDASTPAGKSIIVQNVLDALIPMSDGIARAAHCQWLAKQMELPENIILNQLETMTENARNKPVGNFQNRPAYPRSTPVVFETDSAQTQLWGTLLDLILHHEEFVPELENKLEVTKLLPDSMLGQAINFVMVFYDQGEWSTAMDQIQQMNIFQDATVGRVILDPQYASSSNPTQEEVEQAREAFQDCLLKLQMDHLSRQLEELQQKYAQSSDSEERQKLSRQITDIIAQKRNLRSI